MPVFGIGCRTLVYSAHLKSLASLKGSIFDKGLHRMNTLSTLSALDLARRRALAVVAAAGLATSAGLVWAAEKPVTHTVVMKATSYAPLALTIKRGDTVVWINEDPFPHTVTSAGAFDSKSIAAGASWKYKPRKVGDFAYTCTFHPNMKGTLRVE